MKKVFIEKSELSKTGYAMIEVDENGVEKLTQLDKSHVHSKTKVVTIDLPKNDTNRLCINPSKLSKVITDENPRFELEFKNPSEKSEKSEKSENGKSWEDFMTEEEKALIEKIKVECEKRAIIAEYEAAKKEMEKWQKIADEYKTVIGE